VLNDDEIRYANTAIATGVRYDSLLYRLCPLDLCPGLCDSAWVFILLEANDLEAVKKLIPNGFAPDSDLDSNRVFDPARYLRDFGIEIPRENTRLFVFNRWGEIVFQSDPYAPWEGRRNNRPLPQGTYYYRLVFIRDDKDEILEGPVHLLR